MGRACLRHRRNRAPYSRVAVEDQEYRFEITAMLYVPALDARQPCRMRVKVKAPNLQVAAERADAYADSLSMGVTVQSLHVWHIGGPAQIG
jgi:hypothetical protein